jgi:hypothetical protein
MILGLLESSFHGLSNGGRGVANGGLWAEKSE